MELSVAVDAYLEGNRDAFPLVVLLRGSMKDDVVHLPAKDARDVLEDRLHNHVHVRFEEYRDYNQATRAQQASIVI